MKKVIIITIVAAATAIISSCKVNDADHMKYITYRGKYIYEITSESGISPYLSGIDNVLKAEEVVNAPLEKRDSLEDLYFPDHKIRSDENGIHIKGYADIEKINDIPITEVGAIRYYYTSDFKMNIECVGDDEYYLTSITIAPLEPTTRIHAQVSRYSNIDWSYPSSIYSYKLTGAGLYSEYTASWSVYYDGYRDQGTNSHYDVNYTFDSEKPLLAIRCGNSDCFRFCSGNLHMEVTGTALGNDKDLVDASLKLYNDYVNRVICTIHYRGETKEWNF